MHAGMLPLFETPCPSSQHYPFSLRKMHIMLGRIKGVHQCVDRAHAHTGRRSTTNSDTVARGLQKQRDVAWNI